MAEEHRYQPERLCANNCGFFGSPATQNLCSKCYGSLQLKEQQSTSAKQAFNQTMIASTTPASSSSSTSSPILSSPAVDLTQKTTTPTEEVAVAVAVALPVPQASTVNRCMTCRKRVGLTGFKCRCGSMYCGTHRYPEQHDCTFDFKEMGKEQIAKANPVIKADKLQKI